MKSIIKNKMSLLVSVILVVVMVFSSVSYAADGNNEFPGFTDSGYSDNGFSRDESEGFASQAVTYMTESGLYAAAVEEWGKDNVDTYYVYSSAPCQAYTMYNWVYIACEKGTNIGLFSIKESSGYKRYFLKSNKRFKVYRRYRFYEDGGYSDWDFQKVTDFDANCNHPMTLGTFIRDSRIIATNLPRFNDENTLDNYLKTGDPSGAVNFDNSDIGDSSSFKWDTFKGKLTGGSSDQKYNLLVNATYSGSNMVSHPEDYYVSWEANLKVTGKNKNGDVLIGGYVFQWPSQYVSLSEFSGSYIIPFDTGRRVSAYGNTSFMSRDEFIYELEGILRFLGSISSGQSEFDVDITSCRMYFTFKLWCKDTGGTSFTRSDDIRCLSFDLLNYDGSSQGGEEVDPSEGREDIGSGGGSGGGTGDISQGINININNENTQNNGTGSGSDSSPKIDVADDDFSMTNVWKNVKSLFGLIDDPSTPEPDDGVMQVVKAGMDFLPSQYWTIVIGLLSSAGIVSIIRIFRGS